jgi:hypothetical protein
MRSLLPNLVACLLCAVALPSTAVGGQWHGGVHAGLLLSSFRGTGLYTAPESRLGVSGALRAEYEWKRVSLVIEAGYAEYGAMEPISEVGLSSSAWRLRYLDVPLLLKVPLPGPGSMLPRSGVPGAYVMVGPTVGVSLGGRIIEQINDRERKLDNLRPVDARIMSALGVAFSRGSGAAGLEVRYTEALTRTFDDESARNAAWAVLLFLQR